MAETESESGLKIVDAFDLDPELRALLRPGELVEGIRGQYHHLPRYFYEIPSHEAAREIRVTPHFGLNEFLLVDLKEASRVRAFPRYVPCAIRITAFYLEGRKPYVLVVLTQFASEAGVTTAVAEVSRDIYECLAGMNVG